LSKASSFRPLRPPLGHHPPQRAGEQRRGADHDVQRRYVRRLVPPNGRRAEDNLQREQRGNILTFRPKRRRIKYSVSTETNILIQRAAAELKTAGAREIYVFGSAAKGTGNAASDLDLAVSGLPPSVFYRMGARVSDLIGRSVDLIDLDINTPFTRYLRTENELVRVG
jgi:predicted nucleotidyltransferase